MESLEYFVKEILRFTEKGVVKFVNLGDPMVVSIVLFIILAPFALAYVILARIGMLKFTQMEIKG